MSKKNQVTRDYKIADSELSVNASNLIDSLKRDSKELATHGITDEKILELQKAKEEFSDCKPDEFFEGAVSIATTEKNEVGNLLREKLGTVKTMADNVFGEGSAKTRQFAFGELSRHNDGELITVAKNVVTVGEIRLNDLKDEGLTPEKLEDIRATHITFSKKIDAKNNVVKQRDIATEDRVELGNKLYAIMKKRSNTAKDYFRSKSEAKYNDYLLYDSFDASNEEEDSSKNDPTPPTIS